MTYWCNDVTEHINVCISAVLRKEKKEEEKMKSGKKKNIFGEMSHLIETWLMKGLFPTTDNVTPYHHSLSGMFVETSSPFLAPNHRLLVDWM